ncbi:MAG TPA: hypothetical protein VLK78_02345 [Candidatus Angelobacter sp.]|nr:hypothetical protein [Candidatus Angelobacter sp.]
MKKFLSIFITLAIILVANGVAASFLHFKFLDLAFLTGLIFVILISYFSFSGGWISDRQAYQIQAQTQMKLEKEKREFQPSMALYTAIGYTIVTLLITLIFDRSAFHILKNILNAIGL